MAQNRTDVKKIARWIDRHPRTGWYVAVWAGVITLNAVIGWADTILHLLS